MAWLGLLPPLRKADWEVRDVSLSLGRSQVEAWHYSKGASNTRTYLHGLFQKGGPRCWGVCWWIPPTKSAALATYPPDWEGVLSLSRLVCDPEAPGNAASFLMASSRRIVDPKRWPCLVTYADTWRGHTGAIYLADNWTSRGMTAPSPVFVIGDRMIARKAGPKTRTKAEMLALGAVCLGSFPKHKFVRLA